MTILKAVAVLSLIGFIRSAWWYKKGPGLSIMAMIGFVLTSVLIVWLNSTVWTAVAIPVVFMLSVFWLGTLSKR